jgi:RHS repeat-associated protein
VPIRFGGGELDTQLGLVTMGKRLYDPSIGRFVQPDPIAQRAAPHDGLNPYVYALNNPLSFEDPDGEFAFIVIGIIVGAILGGASAAISGGNIFEGILIGAVAGGVGAAVGIGASALVHGGLAGAALGGAAGGAAGNAAAAFLCNGDVGRAAEIGFLSGLFGGAFGYATTYAVGGMIGGGVASRASGGDFWQGAFEGFLGSVAAGNISAELMWEGQVDANTKFSDGDVIAFEAKSGDTGNEVWSRAIGEPESHVALKTSEGIYDEVPGGLRKTDESAFIGRRYVHSSVGANYDLDAIHQMWNKEPRPQYGIRSGMYVCSTFVNAVTSGATLGLSPGQVVASVNGYRPGMDRVWAIRVR